MNVVAGSNNIASTECKVDGQTFVAALDSCATINVVRDDVAGKLGLVRVKEPKTVEGLGELDLEEVVTLDIDLGVVHTSVKAHVVPSIPVDILLGQEFLSKHSKGYNKMLEEFHIVPGPQFGKESVCAIETMKKLE